VQPGSEVFEPGAIAGHPEPARRYLEHAIEPGTPLAAAVRLRMSGEIKLKRWLPFEAEQVISWDRGFVWRAVVRMGWVRIRGFDRLVDGRALMRWKLFGLVPVVTASGPDIDRSATGRLAAECVWLPSALCSRAVGWAAEGEAGVRVGLPVGGRVTDLELELSPSGRLESVSLQRWGELGQDAGFGLRAFGAIVDDEMSYAGYAIPSRLRVGWDFDGGRFGPDGEFFRCRIEAVRFR
jgi:hypothetical protein